MLLSLPPTLPQNEESTLPARHQESGIVTLQTPSCLVKHTGAAWLLPKESGLIYLRYGEMLIEALQNTTVKTGDYFIYIKPGAVALISNEGNLVRVRVLSEYKMHSVRTHVGKKLVLLSVGEEMLVSNNPQLLNTVFKGDPIPRRRVLMSNLADGECLLRSEISLVALFQVVDVLKKLIKSRDAADQALYHRLTKTAASMVAATGSHGAYREVMP